MKSYNDDDAVVDTPIPQPAAFQGEEVLTKVGDNVSGTPTDQQRPLKVVTYVSKLPQNNITRTTVSSKMRTMLILLSPQLDKFRVEKHS
ncbi:hypothetical protein YC2023_061195 [Brassica napus]